MFGLLLKGLLPKLLLWAGIGGALVAAYFVWQKAIENRAMLKWNNQQLELIVKDQQKLKEITDEIQQKQLEALKEQKERNAKIDQQYDDIEKLIDSVEGTEDDKSSSKILKDTIEELRKE